jgi:hypothetical protein
MKREILGAYMKTYLRSVFLPLVGLQILFKLLSAFLVVIYMHFLYSNPTFFQHTGASAIALSQLFLIFSPVLLFVAYKYFYRHVIPVLILSMCMVTSAVGLQWGDPILLNSVRGTMALLMESVLFWQLVLLATTEDQARWFFPFYVMVASAFVMLMHQHWPWVDKINMESLPHLYGILAALVVAIIAIVYRFQAVNSVKLKVTETFVQSFGTVFTNPVFIGVFCILVGSNVVNHFFLMPMMGEMQVYGNVAGIGFVALAFLVLPKDFYSKNIIIAGFGLWILGLNVMGFHAISEGLGQQSYKAMFILMWPTVVLYPLVYRGLLQVTEETRVLGLTYVVIASFLLSRLLHKVLILS